MTARGDAHPNSNSAWGHEPDLDSGTDWGPREVVSAETVDNDRYEDLDEDEVRLYLVATMDGTWATNGPAPSFEIRAGLFATADGSWAIEERVFPNEGEQLAHSIGRRVDDLSAVPEDSARRWSEIIEEAHHE